jgi:hypothetical protein
MFKIITKKEYIKLDMNIQKDKDFYNQLLNDPNISIQKVDETFIPRVPMIIDPKGNIVQEPKDEQFIKEIIYVRKGEIVS